MEFLALSPKSKENLLCKILLYFSTRSSYHMSHIFPKKGSRRTSYFFSQNMFYPDFRMTPDQASK